MNNIELITKYATEAWDKVYKKEAISSILDGEKDLMQFVGVKTVRIAKHSSDGLGNYQRANKPAEGPYAGFDAATTAGQGYGYPTGDVNLTWEEFKIRIDRARQLRIELFDNEESGELAVTSALTDFSRTKVAPEVDAYVFSELARLAGNVSTSSITLTAGQNGMGYQANGPVQALNDAFAALDEEEVPEEDQVIFASVQFCNKLRSTGELVKILHQNEYKENVSFQVYEYMGREIIAVPGRRFRTNIVLTDNGFRWGEGNKAIDFIVCAKSACYHVVKYDKIRVFDPKLVQDFDGYKVNVRVYHDFFVPDNKRVAVYAHLSDTAAPANDIKFLSDLELGDTDATLTISNIANIPGDILTDGYFLSTTSADVGANIPAGATAIGAYVPVTLSRPESSGSDATYYLYGSRNGKIVLKATNTITIEKQSA